jgi:hypothetical protein
VLVAARGLRGVLRAGASSLLIDVAIIIGRDLLAVLFVPLLTAEVASSASRMAMLGGAPLLVLGAG